MDFFKKHSEKIYFIVLLVFLFAFFYIAHPLIIYDSDDWSYIYLNRNAIPLPFSWNPSKVLPETLMPLSAFLGAYLIYPIMGDYIYSLALLFAIVFISILMVYFWYAYKLIIKKTGVSKSVALWLLTIFVILHFLAYRSSILSSDEYVLYSMNVTCIFNYTIPAILNLILVFYIEVNDGIKDVKEYGIYKSTILLFFIYLAIFSGMFGSQGIAIYSTFNLIYALIKYLKDKKDIKKVLYENLTHFVIVAMWLIMALNESTGTRAASVEGTMSFGLFATCVKTFFSRYISLNYFVVFTIIICIVLGIILLIRKEKKYISILCELSFLFLVSGLYLILVNTKLGGGLLQE